MQDRFSVEVINDDDFPELTAALWEGFENPYQGVLRLFFPIQNNDREATLKANIQGVKEEYYQQQPDVTWIKVVDREANNKIAAAAKWYFYKDNPYAKREGPMVADWFPEGVTRDFATQAMQQFEHPREQMARRAHAFLHIAFALPQYRGQGLSHLFMKWGVSKADSLGLEAWLDASKYGAPVYEKYGFRKIQPNPVKPVPSRELTEEEQKEWAICEQTILPLNATVMWRPVGGTFVEGETPIPWQQETPDKM
ncbi:putative GNAT family acetyltransferase [Aspergillus clavatus NRRL 1]|uniref:GNAT family acetyltransferase, putative n=1 Tax=Aspergillus clavatus (strain ATCC 1007 / CBS 513.65 / DSM 816 / NCTC 3887 / NRRL 1 / QM 1276 / 107) TaxID=344612 RepID=A1C5S5_ASPCL|nr:GNAT family acetyltransferase, putative [Aspergillus clavatus NRRL 1]EAW15043.1 GNAT family acetyltransferase, putative [Aspergillus clavatus NRRL 1]